MLLGMEGIICASSGSYEPAVRRKGCASWLHFRWNFDHTHGTSRSRSSGPATTYASPRQKARSRRFLPALYLLSTGGTQPSTLASFPLPSSLRSSCPLEPLFSSVWPAHWPPDAGPEPWTPFSSSGRPSCSWLHASWYCLGWSFYHNPFCTTEILKGYTL